MRAALREVFMEGRLSAREDCMGGFPKLGVPFLGVV